MIGRDGVAGLVCLLGSGTLLVLTRGLPQPALVPIGPAFYPRIILTIMALLSAALMVSDALGRRAPAPATPVRYRLVVLTFLIFAAYVFALPHLGYRLATFAFVAGLAVVLEPEARRRLPVIVALALVTALLTHYVFEGYLSVLLPRGRLTGF